MSVTIDLPTELERRLKAEAKRRGVSADAFAQTLLEEKLKPNDHSASSVLPRVLAGNLLIKDRSREEIWLRKHRDEYAGQWVALDGENLIASGDDLKLVAKTARELRVPDALMLRVEPSDALPFAGF